MVRIMTGRSETDGHRNAVWIHRDTNTLELFEPHARHRKINERKLQAALMQALTQLAGPTTFKDYHWQSKATRYPYYSNRFVGPQKITNDGNCGIWCTLFVHLRSINPTVKSCDIWFALFETLVARYGIKWREHLCRYLARYKFWSALRPHDVFSKKRYVLDVVVSKHFL